MNHYKHATLWVLTVYLCLLSPLSLAITGSAIKVETTQAGLYNITPQNLGALGVSTGTIDPRTFRLFLKGQAVAISVSGEADGRFDNGDAIHFLAEAAPKHGPNYRQFDKNVYFLQWGGNNGLRIQTRSGQAVTGTTYASAAAFTSTQHFEQNPLYNSFGKITQGDDRYFWEDLNTSTPSVSIQFDLPLLDLADTSGRITARFQGRTDDLFTSPDHHSRLDINACRLSTGQGWDGFSLMDQMESIPQGCLQRGLNTLTITAIDTGASVDGFYFDWIDIEYSKSYQTGSPAFYFSGSVSGSFEFKVATAIKANALRVYDISDSLHPVEIILEPMTAGSFHFFDTAPQSPHLYVAVDTSNASSLLTPTLSDVPVSTLKTTGQGADYILITHTDMLLDAERLSQHRRDHQDLRAITVDVNDIYNVFNHGYPSAQAVKDFLSYAYAQWQPPAMTYVTLMGDAGVSLQSTAPNEQTYVPAHFFRTFTGGEAPSDSWFAELAGNDPVPDVFIGRLPVTPTTAATVVDKIIAYETQPPASWMKNTLFVADDDDPSFSELSTSLSQISAKTQAVRKLFLSKKTDTTSEHLTLMNELNAGQLLAQYTGHGTTASWAFEQLLTSDDIDVIDNGSRLPFFVALSCANGYFVRPSRFSNNGLSLVEAVVNSSSGGIGSWSATFLGFTFDHEFLGRELFKNIFNDGEKALGAATTQARVAALADGASNVTVDAFTLFADPATHLATAPLITTPPTEITPTTISPTSSSGGGVLTLFNLFVLLLMLPMKCRENNKNQKRLLS